VPGVHVFGVEDGGAGLDGRFDDERVPVADVRLLDAAKGELDEGCVDGDDCVLAKLRYGSRDLYLGERWLSLSAGDGDELAEHLCADNNVILFGELIHQPLRDSNFLGLALIGVGECVEKDVRVYERGHCVRSA
jgi:hypothetical protein